MNTIAWRELRSSEEVARRAGGRSRHNRLRAIIAVERRLVIARAVMAAGGLHRGLAAAIARDLCVDRSTVSRDLKVIFESTDRYQCHPGQVVNSPEFDSAFARIREILDSEDVRVGLSTS